MPTPRQIRAARALLDWSQKDLAARAGVTEATIRNAEKEDATPNSRTLDAISRAFEPENIEFIRDGGVELRKSDLTRYQGHEGFIAFMDDVYETAKAQGGEICLFNAKPSYWIQWMGEERYKAHSERMRKIKHRFDFKVTAKKDDWNFIGKDFAEYRWFPEDMFSERAFYAYGTKLAFLNFGNNDMQILVFESSQFADAFRVLFNIAWDKVAIKPSASHSNNE